MLKRGDILKTHVGIYLKVVDYYPRHNSLYAQYKVSTSSTEKFSQADNESHIYLNADFVESFEPSVDVGV